MFFCDTRSEEVDRMKGAEREKVEWGSFMSVIIKIMESGDGFDVVGFGGNGIIKFVFVVYDLSFDRTHGGKNTLWKARRVCASGGERLREGSLDKIGVEKRENRREQKSSEQGSARERG